MDAPERNIMDWDEAEVQVYLSSLGYPQYEAQIKEHNISGDVLCMLDSEGLKAVGVSTIGQRLAILKAVYNLKLAHNVPIEPEHYVPPSEVSERSDGVSVEKLASIVKEQALRLRSLEDENKYINATLQLFLDDLNSVRASLGREELSPLRRQPSFKWAQFVKPARSPTKTDVVDSPHPSPQQLEHDVSFARNAQPPPVVMPPDKPRSQLGTSGDSPVGTAGPQMPKPNRQDSSDNLKSFKVSLDDPTWKVLPAALKKYKINNDNWQNYAMFICYGSPGNRIERCLSYDEKPLLLFQKLKDGKKNPVFMLKHIKDIRSPIAVAQQKHAARKASSVMTVASETGTLGHSKSPSQGGGRAAIRPPKLEVHDLAAPGPSAPLTGVTVAAGGWPEPGVSSPSVDNAQRAEDMTLTGASGFTGRESSASTSTTSTLVGDSASMRSRAMTAVSGSSHSNGHGVEKDDSGGSSREIPVPSGVSYAVAIYPYMAEQEDEFDVVVGDTFVILSRARGWWVVQRDPTGSGVVDTDTSKQGWVPAGCLLETNVPVASAIAEATAAKGSATSGSGGSPPTSPVSRTPILPLSIISTSYPGIALMDYKKKGDEELDLIKDDALRVFKRYNHWSYAVKEEGGDRGWVPSWFIGKVLPPGGPGAVPATPSTSAAPALHSSAVAALDDVTNQAQISPMSSAFPTVQQSSRVT